MTLKETVAKLAEVSGKIQKVFKEAGEDFDLSKATDLPGTTSKERIEALKKMKAEEDELGKRVDEANELLAMKREAEEAEKKALAAGRPPLPVQSDRKDLNLAPKIKTLSECFFERAKDGRVQDLMGKTIKLPENVTLKTTMTTAAGFAPQSIRESEIVPEAVQAIHVIDLIPQGFTSENAVVYMECTTRTNNAAERAESGAAGEAALAYTERTAEVETISVYLPVTDRQLSDVPMIQGEINTQLPMMIRERLDSQIINGDGSTPNLEGMEDKSGIQTQAFSHTIVETLYKGITACRVTGFAEVSGIILHPTDWESIRLMKDNNGNYIWGHPSEVGPERVWGKVVAQTTYQTQGLSCLGDFAKWCKLYERAGMSMKMTDSHASQFTSGINAIRVDLRVAMVWKRPEAFVLATLA